jgi:hypothetical protein
MTLNGASRPSRLRSAVAVIVARVAIPLWLATGAVLKLIDGSPSNLPAALVKWLGGNGVDLRFVLELSIATELVVAGVMVLLPGLARLAGIALLALFLPVLIGDVALGAASCGCFGAVQIPPWVTLVTDLAFLFCLVVLARGVESLRLRPTLPTWRVVTAGIWSVLSVAVAFGYPASADREAGSSPPPEARSATARGPSDGYYLPSYDSWIGKSFRELDIAGWIQGLPADLDQGQQYVMFYRLDCEHCHELMEVFFSGELPLPTTAVAVPEKTGFPTEGLQPFVCGACRLAELPQGFDWFLQTPVLVRLSGGRVECAAEVSAANPVCLAVY